MQATTDDLTNLLRMQQIDLDLMKAKKKLEELPQRAAILAARQKKRAIEQKRDQVAEMRAQAEAKASKLEAEDAELAEKQRRVQETIDGSRGDYRNVEAHSKELGGFAKRRNTLEEELTKLGEELAKIEGVQGQVSRALAELEKQEAAAIAWHMPFDDDQYHRLLSAAGLSKSWTRTMQKRRLSGKIEDFSRRLWGK